MQLLADFVADVAVVGVQLCKHRFECENVLHGGILPSYGLYAARDVDRPATLSGHLVFNTSSGTIGHQMEQNITTWRDVVRDALQELGGEGHLREINGRVEGHPKTKKNPTWRDTIRRVVRQYSIFQPIGKGRSGRYRLVEQPSIEPEPEKMTGRKALDHAIAQGMLLALGRLYGYETFAPAPDRTTCEFQGKRLSDYCTVTDCELFCQGPSLNRVRQIDAIWLTEDNVGPFPAYAFEVEHTTRVKNGMDRLVEIPERFPAQLFVVAPGDEEARIFKRLIGENRFRNFRDRLVFRDYSQLEGLFNAALKHDSIRSSFGVVPRHA